MNEQTLFAPGGWAHTHYPQVRHQLYFLLDDGWDVPYRCDSETQMWRFGSLEVAQARFPSFTGTPEERLRALNEHFQRLGWRGAGLWIAAQEAGQQPFDPAAQEAYWRTRLHWSRVAGIQYWKVDWASMRMTLLFDSA